MSNESTVRPLSVNVPEDDLVVVEVLRRVVAAFAMLHGNDELLPGLAPCGERCVRALDPYRHVGADELE